MLFNSIPFIFFFAVVTILYFGLPHRFRWIMLLGASYYFYMCWKVEYVFLIMLTTTVDFFVARKIAALTSHSKRKRFLAVSLVCNLGILFGFKYFNFVSASTADLLASLNIFIDAPVFKALLPVGISFYTFQSLSYVLDVYRKKTKPENHLGYYALYVSFWPQLVAGPIERSYHLLPQLRARYNFSAERVTSGLRLMLLGMFKKVVIADQMAIHVNQIYNHPEDQAGTAFLQATFFFAIQIYCDFSGYTDVARGAARVMGYDLMENFRAPYLATSIHDFWRRWHISLSTWFRDYVYIPLGGNRQGRLRWNLNLLIMFFISGLWHGANWTFIIWGVLHGCFLIAENSLNQLKNRFNSVASSPAEKKRPVILVLQTIFTFLLVCLGWIFFRANSLHDALFIIGRIAAINLNDILSIPLPSADLLLPFILAAILLAVDLAARSKPLEERLSSWPPLLRWSLYTGAFWG